MGDLAQLSGGDQFPGGGNGGCIPVVEADCRGHTLRFAARAMARASETLSPTGFSTTGASRSDDGGADLAVQEVGCGDADCADVRIIDDRAPVGDRGSGAELPGRLGSPPWDVVGDGHQIGELCEPRIVMAHPRIRLRVHATHPAESDYCDGHGLLRAHHRRFSDSRCFGDHCGQPPAHERRMSITASGSSPAP
jgi:hypothetical protein